MKFKKLLCFIFAASFLLLTACQNNGKISDNEKKAAAGFTAAANKKIYDMLNFNDKDEVMLAQMDCLDNPEVIQIVNENGDITFSQQGYSFINDLKPSPDEVNPSLWNNSQLNKYYGLFVVEEDFLYQVRGYDVTNLTVIAKDEGYIVINPMSNIECASAAMQLIYRDIGVRPILSVILTTPSVDCWGGIQALVNLNKEHFNQSFDIIAPSGFEENVMDQYKVLPEEKAKLNAYQNGHYIEHSQKGALSVGNGLSAYSGSSVMYVSPNVYIEEDKTISINSVELEFSLENMDGTNFMNVFIKDRGVLYLAENAGSSLQNLFDLASGKNYDPNQWAKFLLDTLAKYQYALSTVVQAHNWPHKGNDGATLYIKDTAKAYKYIHDQTVYGINQGLSKSEILDNMRLPEDLNKVWYLRQYSQTVKNCAENVYDLYMKDYIVDFTKISCMPDDKKARKFIEYMGDDKSKILKQAKEDFNKGEYQWVCEITKLLILDDPNDEQAKYLCADALEQLAYLSESGVDRNLYLTYAQELRGQVNQDDSVYIIDPSIRDKMTVDGILDLLSSKVNKDEAQKQDFTFNLYIKDMDENYCVEFDDGVMLYYKSDRLNSANASIHTNKNLLFSFIYKDEYNQNYMTVYGDMNVIDVLNKIFT